MSVFNPKAGVYESVSGLQRSAAQHTHLQKESQKGANAGQAGPLRSGGGASTRKVSFQSLQSRSQEGSVGPGKAQSFLKAVLTPTSKRRRRGAGEAYALDRKSYSRGPRFVEKLIKGFSLARGRCARAERSGVVERRQGSESSTPAAGPSPPPQGSRGATTREENTSEIQFLSQQASFMSLEGAPSAYAGPLRSGGVGVEQKRECTRCWAGA